VRAAERDARKSSAQLLDCGGSTPLLTSGLDHSPVDSAQTSASAADIVAAENAIRVPPADTDSTAIIFGASLKIDP